MKDVPPAHLVSESTRRRNPHLYGQHPVTAEKQCQDPASSQKTPLQGGARPAKRLRQSAKPLLNKLEAEFLRYLTALLSAGGKEGPRILSQAKRFKLANGIWYKPDFTAIVKGVEVAWEVKGPHVFRGGFENLKVAASAYPEVTWLLVWKDGGEWREQHVVP